MSIVNSLLKQRLLVPLCIAAALAGLPVPSTGQAWLDELGTKSAFADDEDDRYDDDRYGDDDDNDDDDGDDD